LRCGYDGQTIHFDYRPYEARTEAARAAYDRLRADLLANGLKDPLITYRDHILIGMRRFEILRDKRDSFPCIEILEDVRHWTRDDLRRLNELKRDLYGLRLNEFVG
tara:strand:- start:788 stop:1105 length:318 start_codon:yes stop_codon:yes gene_type:complete